MEGGGRMIEFELYCLKLNNPSSSSILVINSRVYHSHIPATCDFLILLLKAILCLPTSFLILCFLLILELPVAAWDLICSVRHLQYSVGTPTYILGPYMYNVRTSRYSVRTHLIYENSSFLQIWCANYVRTFLPFRFRCANLRFRCANFRFRCANYGHQKWNLPFLPFNKPSKFYNYSAYLQIGPWCS